MEVWSEIGVRGAKTRPTKSQGLSLRLMLEIMLGMFRLTPLIVRRCWLAMPLGAGILHWGLACHIIEEEKNTISMCMCHTSLELS